MSITARELWYAGYQYAGRTTLEQTTLNRDEEEDARRMFNGMTDTWRADGYLVSHIKRNLFAIVGSQADYTIGPGGQWDHSWPDRVDRASVVLTSQTGPPEYPMAVLTDDEYKAWIIKSQVTNFPYACWYERAGPPLGIIHLLYVPTDVNQVALYLEEPLAAITIPLGTPPDYSTVTLDFQPAYQEAIETNLARRILMRAPNKSTLDGDAKAELRNMARTGMALIRNANQRPLSRTTDLSPRGGPKPYVLTGTRYF